MQKSTVSYVDSSSPPDTPIKIVDFITRQGNWKAVEIPSYVFANASRNVSSATFIQSKP
jgi:hypothetical protein